MQTTNMGTLSLNESHTSVWWACNVCHPSALRCNSDTQGVYVLYSFQPRNYLREVIELHIGVIMHVLTWPYFTQLSYMYMYMCFLAHSFVASVIPGLIVGPFPPPGFDCLQYTKKKRWQTLGGTDYPLFISCIHGITYIHCEDTFMEYEGSLETHL